MNPLETINCFADIYSFWPNKDNRSGSLQGFKYICTENDLNADKLIMSAKAYCFESDHDYVYQLGNWMRDDHYLVYYGMQKDELEKLTNKFDAAMAMSIELIEKWNKCSEACSRLNPVLAISDRSKIVMRSFRNEFFYENHVSALKWLYRLASENSPLLDDQITIQWFCEIKAESNTVADILEGKYGKLKKKKAEEEREPQPQDFVDPDEALNYFHNL